MDDAKRWLQRAGGVDREIAALLKTRDAAYDQLTQITAQLTGDAVQATKDPHKYDRLALLDDTIDRRVDRLVEIKTETLAVIAQLEDWRYREILQRRYVDMQTFERIAVDMAYSWRQVIRLHGGALVEVRKILEKMSWNVIPGSCYHV